MPQIRDFVAVKSVLNGNTCAMISMSRNEEYNISYETVDVSKVCNKEKTFPTEWIINKKDISDEFIKYVSPIIKGNIEVSRDDNGLPKYLKRG